MLPGPMPAPAAAWPASVLDEVTKGRCRGRCRAWHPARPRKRMRLPACRARSSSRQTGAAKGSRQARSRAAPAPVLRPPHPQSRAAPERVVVEQQSPRRGRSVSTSRRSQSPDRAAAHLVLVGRADASARRAEPGAAPRLLPRLVELAVDRQDEADILRDRQRLRAHGDALARHRVDLGQQRPRIDHHAVADHRELAAAHHARRQQAQLVLDAVNHQRVAGVMTALKAHHDIRPAGQPVDDLALALVAPLGADDRHVAHA